MTQLTPTFAGVVVAEEEIALEVFYFEIFLKIFSSYIEGSHAVPAEHVFTPATHHLGTSGVTFYRDTTHRTPLDVLRVDHQLRPVLLAREARVPRGLTSAAELRDARGTRDGRDLCLTRTHVADGVTVGDGAPGPAAVPGHLSVESEHLVLVHHVPVHQLVQLAHTHYTLTHKHQNLKIPKYFRINLLQIFLCKLTLF